MVAATRVLRRVHRARRALRYAGEMPLPGSRPPLSISDLLGLLGAVRDGPAMRAAGAAIAAPVHRLGQDVQSGYQTGLDRLASPPSDFQGLARNSLDDLGRTGRLGVDLSGLALSPLFGIGAGLRQSLIDNFGPQPTGGPAGTRSGYRGK